LRVLLLILIAMSLGLFVYRLRFVLKRILEGRRDPDFTLSQTGKRFWLFFSEVLCQSKVIRERPLPGLAHAFVFWSFCAFALVTCNHIARGFGLTFLDYRSGFGAVY
jgi:hypothetical protein